MTIRPAESSVSPVISRCFRHLIGCVLILCVGCIDGDPELTGSLTSPIVGGAIENGYPLVGALAVDIPGTGPEAFCTATAVTPTVLLTAAHCLDVFDDLVGYTIVFHQTFEDEGEAVTPIVAESRVNHPDWTGHIGGGTYSDIGLVQMAEPIDGTLFPLLHSTDLSARVIGTHLIAVGFGITSDEADDAGIKRSVEVVVTRVLSRAFGIEGYPDPWSGTCNGDSGGPAFNIEGERDVQWGINVRGSAMVCGPGEETAIGTFYDDFLVDTIVALDPNASECGDGLCTGIEEEEDCLVDCAKLECGDGLQVPPEVCDDGNTESGDGCSADCSSDESCGNGIIDIEAGEICDDGNVDGGDGCAPECDSDESCGNSIIDTSSGEVCDDGNTESGDGCSAECSSDESCGNGILDEASGEICDDGNTESGDGCSAECSSDESCGNGILDEASGEDCDDGNAVDDDECTNACATPADDTYGAGGGGDCDCIAAPRHGQSSLIRLIFGPLR